ncbi:MAG TPA: hydantoinase B/oxoprolinase family protein [Sneathiellales bacterium]|nr:hydantoinase B/oxoprolinase family protein [Sneathiellales bacterium]
MMGQGSSPGDQRAKIADGVRVRKLTVVFGKSLKWRRLSSALGLLTLLIVLGAWPAHAEYQYPKYGPWWLSEVKVGALLNDVGAFGRSEEDTNVVINGEALFNLKGRIWEKIWSPRPHLGFSANTAHHIDIGSATPGLIIDIPDVFAEGMLFAGVKLYEKGKRNEGLWKFIGNNSRTANMLRDDIEAQIAAARLGVTRFQDLIEKYGLETVKNSCDQLMDYSEKMLRKRIAEIPDGEYTAEGWCDDDGRNRDVRLPIKVTVTIDGDNAEVDLTGSADQVPTGYNVPFEGSTKVACYFAFRALLLDQATTDEYIPQNQGSFRPISVVAPLGSIFNPKFPAAAEARFTQCNRLIDCVVKALAPVMPDRVIAGSSASLSFIAYAGLRPTGDYWVFLEVNEGSYGGRPKSDGPDSIDNLMCNTRNNPIEDLGMHLPMVCDRYELRDDTLPGAGKHRGGFGVVKSQRVLTDASITHECDRHTDVPWGIFGGNEGAVGKVQIYNTGSPDEIQDLPAKFSGLSIKANDVVAFYAPCGGGYGDPLERTAAQVLDDVLDDFCTIEEAFSAYGVVIYDDLKLDEAATETRRAELGTIAAE